MYRVLKILRERLCVWGVRKEFIVMICVYCVEYENEDNGLIKFWSKILRFLYYLILYDDMLREVVVSLYVFYFGIMEYILIFVFIFFN